MAVQARHSPHDLAELPGRARALIPALRKREAEAEAARMLHAETIAEIRDAGLYRVLQPQRYGGYGGALPDMIDVAYEIGRGSSAAAWIFGNVRCTAGSSACSESRPRTISGPSPMR